MRLLRIAAALVLLGLTILCLTVTVALMGAGLYEGASFWLVATGLLVFSTIVTAALR